MLFPTVITIISFKIVRGRVLDIRFLVISFFASYIAFPAFFAFVFGPVALLQRFSDIVFGATVKELNFSFIIHNLGIFILFIASFWKYFLTGQDKRITFSCQVPAKLLFAFNIIYLCILLYIFFFVIDIRSVLSWDYIQYHKFVAGKGVFLFWLNTFPFIIGVNLLLQQSTRWKIFWVIIYLFLSALLVIATGKRSYIFPSLVGVLFYLLHLKKIHWVKVAVILIVTYGTMHAYGFIRAFKGEADLMTQLQKGWNFAVNHKELLINDEFSASIINTTGIIKLLKSDRWNYQYGWTLMEFFPNIIPHIIEPDRKDVVAQRFAKKVSFERYRAGGAFGFSVVGDSYLNFGVFGVFTFFLVLGFLLQKIALRSFPFKEILIFGLLPAIIFFTRSSFSGTLKSAIIHSGIPFILFISLYYLAYKYLIINNNKNS